MRKAHTPRRATQACPAHVSRTPWRPTIGQWAFRPYASRSAGACKGRARWLRVFDGSRRRRRGPFALRPSIRGFAFSVAVTHASLRNDRHGEDGRGDGWRGEDRHGAGGHGAGGCGAGGRGDGRLRGRFSIRKGAAAHSCRFLHLQAPSLAPDGDRSPDGRDGMPEKHLFVGAPFRLARTGFPGMRLQKAGIGGFVAPIPFNFRARIGVGACRGTLTSRFRRVSGACRPGQESSREEDSRGFGKKPPSRRWRFAGESFDSGVRTFFRTA